MATRKTITKKLRFEIFKRDNFTCQYCGKSAPEVVLEVDHINPVANGGDNDILNLVTSCYDCNRGKGARELTDNQMLEKQKEQLKELNEKRNQLKMMVKWKEELSKLEDEQVDECEKLMSIWNAGLSDAGRNDFKKWIKRYGFKEVYETFGISLQQYIETDKEGKVDENSLNKAINYFSKIINNKKKQEENPLISKLYYIKGIIRNRRMLYNENRLMRFLYSIKHDEISIEEITDLAKTCASWSDFWEVVNDTYEGGW